MTSPEGRGGVVTKNGDILINNSSLSPVSPSCFNENQKFENTFILCNRKQTKSLSFYKEVVRLLIMCKSVELPLAILQLTPFNIFAEYPLIFRQNIFAEEFSVFCRNFEQSTYQCFFHLTVGKWKAEVWVMF